MYIPYVLGFLNPCLQLRSSLSFWMYVFDHTFLPLVVGIHEQVENKMHFYIAPKVFQ